MVDKTWFILQRDKEYGYPCNSFVTQLPNRQGSNRILFNDTNGKEQIEITTTGNKIETIEKDSRDASAI